jgi:hypothetical protein
VGGRAKAPNCVTTDARSQLRELHRNRFGDAIEIAIYVVIGESQNDKAVRGDCGCPSQIASDLLVARMRRAIDFDSESCFQTSEVGDEASENDLPAKPVPAHLFASQTLPEPPLGVGGVSPQGAGGGRQTLSQCATPHPVPPPQGGRGR